MTAPDDSRKGEFYLEKVRYHAEQIAKRNKV